MKNKHLFFIFISTLLLGLIARYSPWFKSDTLQSALIKVSREQVKRLVVTVPGDQELVLERNEYGWVAAQDGLAVGISDSSMMPLLHALGRIEATRIVHSSQPDSLWLLPSQGVAVKVETSDGLLEHFFLGREVLESGQAATYLKIAPHDGIYLVKGHLRRLFSLKIDDFRSKTLLTMPEKLMNTILMYRVGFDTLVLQKSDSAQIWLHGQSPMDSAMIANWFQALQQLNGLPFATTAQEAASDDLPALKVHLSGAPDTEPVLLEFYGLTYRFGRDSVLDLQLRNTCLVHSSDNPFNFFSMKDAGLLRRICFGLDNR